jgi:hypothetical protein
MKYLGFITFIFGIILTYFLIRLALYHGTESKKFTNFLLWQKLDPFWWIISATKVFPEDHFMEGSGYTIIDGEKFSWEEGDVLQIPLRWDGVVFQHFNNDSKREAILVCAEPNFVHSLGVDRGSGFEVLETAPEYKG